MGELRRIRALREHLDSGFSDVFLEAQTIAQQPFAAESVRSSEFCRKIDLARETRNKS